MYRLRSSADAFGESLSGWVLSDSRLYAVRISSLLLANSDYQAAHAVAVDWMFCC